MNFAKDILVATADPWLAESILEILRGSPYSASAAGSLSEALTRLSASSAFAGVICEYSIPGGTCLELIAWLRQHQRTRLPVVLISETWSRSYSAAAGIEFLACPFNAARLLAILGRLVPLPVPFVAGADGSDLSANRRAPNRPIRWTGSSAKSTDW